MKCRCCDQLLNDYESVRKDPESGEYLDTCSYCVSMSRPETIDKLNEENSYQNTGQEEKNVL